MQDTNPETIRRLASFIAALAAILVTLLVCVIALNLLPDYYAAYALFQYGDELVGIDLYGALVPLFACLPLLYLKRGHPSSMPGDAGILLRRLFAVSLVPACLLPVSVFALVRESSGSLVLGTLGGALAILFGGVLGAAYATLRGTEITIFQGSSECFIICVVGSFASDIIRTLTGLASASGGALVWGGGGSHDLVLWFGIYMVLSYLTFRLIFPASSAYLEPIPKMTQAAKVL